LSPVRVGDHPDTAKAIAKNVGIISEFSTRDDLAKYLRVNPEDVDERDVHAMVMTGDQQLSLNYTYILDLADCFMI